MSIDREQRLAAGIYRNLRILAVLTLVLMALLAVAPARSYFREWRGLQHKYNTLAQERGFAPVPVGVKQIWRPEIGLTDRCVSCHLGMSGARPIPAGGPLFGAHPQVHHDVSKMGCTICHQGQGLATNREDAHGHVKHWEQPVVPTSLMQASCGQCHADSTVVPPLELVERGEYLFDLHGCKACHVVDGAGGTVGPDLSGVALKGYSRDWHIEHLRRPSATVEGSQMMNFGHLNDDELNAILAYLETLIGAPKLIRGKAIAMSTGCRGCHKIGGFGGDHGPSLTDSANTLAVDRVFSRIGGPETNENWQRQHLRDPQAVSPGSKMPAFALNDTDEEALLTFIFSERRTDLPLEQLPDGTIMVRLEKGRDYDPRDGRTLYRMYCSACHGPDGSGQVMPTLRVTVPAITNPDVLAVASDEYLAATILHGRPAREMPPWSSPGGLTRDEVEVLVGWLRGHQAAPVPFESVSSALRTPSIASGRKLYRADCAGCHGVEGEGTVIGPSLINAEFRAVADARYVYETVVNGRSNTAMPAHRSFAADELADLISFILTSGEVAPVTVGTEQGSTRQQIDQLLSKRLFVDSLDNYTATGSAIYGKVLYEGMCKGCHGPDAQGGIAPALASPDFLRAASDGFIAGSILLGRGERAMRSFETAGLEKLSARDIGDLITYLHAASTIEQEHLGRARVQGDAVVGERRFATLCAGCHGVEGIGGFAPSLNNQAFLNAATDGFLQATIARGRRGTAMRAWAVSGFGFAELTPVEINDLVAYIRSWQAGENR